MKPFLYQKLLSGLLLELANESYSKNEKFLSRRKICALWSVSAPTAESALDTLCQIGLLEVRLRSGFYVTHGARRRALQLLNAQKETVSLGRKDLWARKRSLLLNERPTHRRTLAMIFDGLEYPSVFSGGNPDFLESCSLSCARGCQEAAGQDYGLEFFALRPDDIMLPSLEMSLKKRRYDGIVLFRRNQLEHTMKPLIERMSRHRIPIVCAFYTSEDTDAYAIDINNIGVGYQAGRIFAERGVKHVGVFVHPGVERSKLDRIRGLKMGLDEAGGFQRRLTTLRMVDGAPVTEAVARKLQDQANRPEALFFPSHEDFDNLGPFLKKSGLLIPRDLSVIMTSSLSRASGLKRDVDLMKIDFREIGRRTVGLMKNILEGSRNLPKLTLIDLAYESHGTVTKRRAPRKI